MHAPQVAVLQREWGHAVAVKKRSDLIGARDDELIWAATTERRVIVTENVKDFTVLHRRILAGGQDHCGLILTHTRRFPRSAPNHIRVLTEALAVLLSEHGTTLDEFESPLWWLRLPDQ